MNNSKVARTSIWKLGNTRNKTLCSVLALWMTQPCYPSVAVITVLSVLHRKQLLFSRQSVRLAFLWVKIPSILIHINHDSQSLPEIWLLCLKCLWSVRSDFSGLLSLAFHLPTVLVFSGTTYLFKDYLNDVSHVTQGKGQFRFLGWYCPSYPHASLMQRELPFVLRGDGFWEVLKPVCKCTLKTAQVLQRLLFCFMICTIASSFATLRAFSGVWKSWHPSYSSPEKKALKDFRKKKNSSLTWILEVAQAGCLAWKISCLNIFKSLAKSQTRETWVL